MSPVHCIVFNNMPLYGQFEGPVNPLIQKCMGQRKNERKYSPKSLSKVILNS